MMTETCNLYQYLSANPYPGRGVLLGLNEAGDKAIVAYFIMGRSVNSRNRIFVAEGEGIRTQAHDESLVSDPSLIIYNAVRKVGGQLIVTNGSQTDDIYTALEHGEALDFALADIYFEPDEPNFTPRISGVLTPLPGACSYEMSILKRAESGECQRLYWVYTAAAGAGHIIHTYAGDGAPLPSFRGEPVPVQLTGDIDRFSAQLWQSLDAENRVSLFVRYIDLASGQKEDRIINKHAE